MVGPVFCIWKEKAREKKKLFWNSQHQHEYLSSCAGDRTGQLDFVVCCVPSSHANTIDFRCAPFHPAHYRASTFEYEAKCLLVTQYSVCVCSPFGYQQHQQHSKLPTVSMWVWVCAAEHIVKLLQKHAPTAAVAFTLHLHDCTCVVWWLQFVKYIFFALSRCARLSMQWDATMKWK